MENQVTENNVQANPFHSQTYYAGFWIRVGASLIDFVVLLPLIAFNVYNIYKLKSLPLQVTVILLMILYKPLLEGFKSATLGKMAMKIKVVNAELQNINLGQAITRYIPWLFSQGIALYSALLLFQHPDFLTANGFMEVGQLQGQLLPPIYNMMASLLILVCVIFVAFTPKKQGLHDFLADTRVICTQPPQEDEF